MTLFDHAGLAWLAGAVLLAVAELFVPGVFLIFLAIAAAIVGALLLVLPDMSPLAQVAGFIAWSVVAVVIGRRWYRDYPVESSAPLLNDRVARLIGETVTVSEAIENGSGRVRVADGEWPAHGPDMASGTRAVILAARDGVLIVEPVPQQGDQGDQGDGA